MKNRHLSILQKDAGFSPEQLGARLGINGKTIRRWAELPQNDPMPAMYEKVVRETVYELLAEGALTSESEVVKHVLSDGKDNIFYAAMKDLGFAEDFLKNADQSPNSVVEGIVQIGASEKKQDSVNRSKEKIFSYGKLGGEWKYRVQTLVKAITSKELSRLDKFAAYGALFYLISPFDLIPDHIPVFGLMDDYVILGLVVAYYIKRFPKIFANANATENDKP